MERFTDDIKTRKQHFISHIIPPNRSFTNHKTQREDVLIESRADIYLTRKIFVHYKHTSTS